MNIKLSQSTQAMVSLLASIFLFGTALSVVKIALVDYDPLFMVFIRMLTAFLVLTPLVLIRCRPLRIPSKRDLGLLILLAMFDPIGFFVFEALGVQYTSSSQAGMMWALGPLLNTMGAWIILRERTTPTMIACFLVAMGGVMLLTLSSAVDEHASNPILGNFFIFLCLCGAAGFMVILRFLRGKYPAILVVWVQTMIGTVFLLPTLPLGLAPLPQAFHWESFMTLIYLGVGVTFGAQACAAFAVARMPIAKYSAMENLVPVVALFTGLIVLGERMLPLQWLACAIIFAAVLVSQRVHRG